jgi:phosphatidylglycerol---prolipoprotein diacylglyceryl transferase
MNIYGFLIGVGVAIIVLTLDKIFKDKVKLQDYLLIGLATLFFARLAFIIHHIPLLLEDYLLFFKIYEGGVSILGAIVGFALSSAIIAKLRNLKFFALTDALFLNLPVVQAIGRIGNFFNQEIYGYPTNLPWGIYINPENRISGYTNFERFHPIFAYELILNLINWGILFKLSQKYKISSGVITTFFILNYGIIRLLVNRLRIEKGYLLGVETGDFFSSILITVGILLVLYVIANPKIQKSLATVVSKILNPFLIIAIPFFVIAFQRNLFSIEPTCMTAILFLGILGPLFQFHIFKKLNLINDWDISDRSKRPFFTTIAGTIFLLIFLISLLSVSTEIKVLTLSLTIMTYLFAIISTVWKISGHLTYLAFTICSLYLLTKSPIFIFILPIATIIVGWSRFKLKQHTIPQIIAGVALGFGVMFITWYLATQPLPF